MKKRVLSMLLMLTMVFSLIVVPNTVSAGTYYDTVDTDYELAVDVLSALGIMGGYTDGSFLPYNTITRAEMVAVAVKLAGIDGYSDEAPDDMELFNDMYDYDGWASGVIAIAKTAGIARSDEDGNFNPDMSTTYEEALQMVVSALGYGHQAVSRGDTLNDYVYVAQRLGLTKKLDTGIGQNITRADVAKLVYNALTVDLMMPVSYSVDGTVVTYESVEGVNALNTYFDVYEVKGIITENEYAAIDGDTTVDELQVLINDEVFNVGSTDIDSYLGYYATVYALESEDATDNRTIVAYSIKNVKNNTLTIDADNIEDVISSIEGYTFEYWADKNTDKKTKDVSTSATPLVLYNGKAVIDVTEELLVPDNGHIVLIDNNGDDDYDIIDIWEYELIYVFSASQSSGNVTGYYDRSTTYKFDAESEDYRVTFLNEYGGVGRMSDIKQYSVLYVYESLDKMEKKVVISNKKINGTVEEVSNDGYYTIAGVEYEISPAVEGLVELAVSDAGDYYLDADGRIAGFEGTTVIRKNIGMFIAINDGGIRDGYQIKVLTANSGVRVYNLATSIKVNDTRMSDADFYELAFTDALFGESADTNYTNNKIQRAHPSRAAFLYKLNSKDEISEVTVVGEEDGYLQVRQLKTAGSLYYSTKYSCLHYSGETVTTIVGDIPKTEGKRTYCDNSTINFIMDEAAAHTDDNQSFYVKPMNTYWNNANFNDFDTVWAYYYSPDESEIDMQKTVCNFLVMNMLYSDAVDSGADEWRNDVADYDKYYGDNVAPKFIYKITEANDRATNETTLRVYYFDGANLRNALIRPEYSWVGYDNYRLYPNGFPVRIATDGAYIEGVGKFFGSEGMLRDMWTMVEPIYNESTDTNVMPIMPFYQQQHRRWDYWASNNYYSQYYCGVVTSVDQVVNIKLFNVAYATSESGEGTEEDPYTYDLGILSNERLEGNVFRMNYSRDGKLDSITKVSTSDVVPGQLILMRRRAYDTSPKWESLTGYDVNEIFILSDDASELDYLKDFYDQVQERFVEAE